MHSLMISVLSINCFFCMCVFILPGSVVWALNGPPILSWRLNLKSLDTITLDTMTMDARILLICTLYMRCLDIITLATMTMYARILLICTLHMRCLDIITLDTMTLDARILVTDMRCLVQGLWIPVTQCGPWMRNPAYNCKYTDCDYPGY